MNWRIGWVGLILLVRTASAGTVSFGFSLQGSVTGMPLSGGGVNFNDFANPFTGTLPPFGPCTANFSNPNAITFTLANGTSILSTGVSKPGASPLSLNVTGTIVGGTGIFSNATGTYSVEVVPTAPANGPITGPVPLTITGSGTINAPGASGGVSLVPDSLLFQSSGDTLSAPQVLILSNQGFKVVSFTLSTSSESSANWLSASTTSPTVSPGGSSAIGAVANPAGLKNGVYEAELHVDYDENNNLVDLAVPAFFAVGSSGAQLETSQTGLTFQAIINGPPPASQSFQVSNVGIGDLSGLTMSTSVTGSGPNWLQASIASGFANQTQAQVTVTVNPGNLPLGTYYGQVVFKLPNALNTPQTVSVQMVVGQGPPPTFQPNLVSFSVPYDANNQTVVPPDPIVLSVTNPQSRDLSFTMSPAGNSPNSPSCGNPPPWFQISPMSGTIGAGQTQSIMISVNPANLLKSIECEWSEITVTFPDIDYSFNLFTQLNATSTSQAEPVPPWGAQIPGFYPPSSPSAVPGAAALLSGANSSSYRAKLRAEGSGGSCTPEFLFNFLTSVPVGFQAMVGQPMPLIAEVYDNCGNNLISGSVIATFASGESPVVLNSIGGGQWAGTWTPRDAGSYNGITLQSVSQDGLFGSMPFPGSVAPSTATPIITSGGVVDAASGTAIVAPGDFISIYGSNLAGGTTVTPSTPFPNSLGNVQVFLGGESLPLYFTASGQIDAIVPFDLSTNGIQQVVVQKGNALSQPETVVVAAAAPAVFTQNQSGSGPGAIQGVKPGGEPVLNTPSSPSSAGDALIIYCTGLGTVHPAITAGKPASTTTLSYADNAVTVTVGGQNAPVLFAGLAPGYVGLYQVNVTVPSGIAASNSVPVVLTQGGLSSAPVTVALH